MPSFSICDGRGIFHSAYCEYMQPGCICDGWQAGAGLELQVQHNTEHLHLCFSGKKVGIKTEKPKQNGMASVLCV